MRIRNLQKITVYMGYEASGFYLGPGEVSHELSENLKISPYLQADIASGSIELVPAGYVEPAVKKAKAAPAPVKEPESAPVPEKPKVDPIRESVGKSADQIKSTEDKTKYLNETLQGENGAAAQAAADLLIKAARERTAAAEAMKAAGVPPKAADAMFNPGPDKAEEPKQKHYGNMTKIELVEYALELGLNVLPTTGINEIRKLVKEKLQHVDGK